jgi:hypothetical protein
MDLLVREEIVLPHNIEGVETENRTNDEDNQLTRKIERVHELGFVHGAIAATPLKYNGEMFLPEPDPAPIGFVTEELCEKYLDILGNFTTVEDCLDHYYDRPDQFFTIITNYEENYYLEES